MVALTDVHASNDEIASSLPDLVAVFVGATSGIGLCALKEFARHASRPRVYFIARSQEAADATTRECQALCPEGKFIFIKADVALLRNVDEVCQEIKSKENAINLLFLTQGTLNFSRETDEGLKYVLALTHFSRARFIISLLPLLQQGTGLRRVISVFAGGKEGKLYTDDLEGRNIPVLAGRGHMSALLTLFLEAAAKKAPDVSFVHNFPGAVKSGAMKDVSGVQGTLIKTLFAVAGPFIFMKDEECGERHLFLATSARYGPSEQRGASGVPLSRNITLAIGTDGKGGSGVYSTGSDGETSGPKVQALLAKYKSDGVQEHVWDQTQAVFTRVLGSDGVKSHAQGRFGIL
ncbi:MAG: hypothetical protein M1828_002212 [Chrysothrix sp. TS-e1954]|nr:MAG: hypothetical protein M1828_002212 [Chrysothrix sp. TS-e1954]